jgi:methylglutaconyl-CoA hydratase
MPATIKIATEGAIARITLNRPDKRNAISPDMIDELLAALDKIEEGDARVVVIAGEGKGFCSGMDLGALRNVSTQSTEEHLTDARRTATLFQRLWNFPKPLIAAVHGAAMAGGCGIATMCDFTLASEDATFGYTEVRVGFMPALVSLFLVRQVGEKIARDLLLSGRILSARDALELGLITRVVTLAELGSATNELAATLASYSPESLAATKRLLKISQEAAIEREIELAVAASAAIRSTADFREGLSAFLEKRKAHWSGR